MTTQNRFYSSPAQSTTLAANITSTSATSITVTGNPTTLSWPSSFPYTIGVDWGTNVSEAMSVTGVSGSGPYTLTVTRGIDGTTAQTHTASATNTVFHIVSGEDFGEAQMHMWAPTPTTYSPSGTTVPVHGITGSVVGTTDTQTLTNKNLASGTNTFPTFNQSTTGNAATATSATTAGGAPPTGSASGGLGGTYPSPTVNVTSPITYGSNTVGIQASSGSQAGSMSAAQASLLASLVTGMSGWIDVTQQGSNSLTPNSTGAASTNSTNLATLISNATAGETIFFPQGTYSFSSNITVNKALTFMGQMGQGGNVPGTYLQMTTASAGLFTVNTNWGPQFVNLGFTCNITQTSGAAITNAGMDYVNILNCVFGGSSSTVTLFNCINYTGATANNWTIANCNFGNFSSIAISLSVANGYVTNCVINGQYGSSATYATAGIEVSSCGGLFISDCDIVTCTNNLLCNPTGTGTAVSINSLQCVNTYFDQSNGASLAISGAGAFNRCLFSSCWFTTLPAASSPSCISIDSTYAYTTSGQGIIISGCFIYNTGSTATATGVNLQAFGDIEITDSCISGWTTGISMTASTTAGVSRPLISGNVIGPSGNITGNATGINLGSGTTYGNISITANNMGGNTSNPLLDSSTVTLGSQKLISGNTGLPITMNTVTPSATGTALTTGLVTYGTLSIPANSLRAGQIFKLRATGVQTATVGLTYTTQVTLGTTPSNLFATAETMVSTAVVGHWVIEILVYIVSSASSTTVEALAFADMKFSGATTAAGNTAAPAATAATIADASATTMNLQIQVSAADATLWGPVIMEVIQQ